MPKLVHFSTMIRRLSRGGGKKREVEGSTVIDSTAADILEDGCAICGYRRSPGMFFVIHPENLEMSRRNCLSCALFWEMTRFHGDDSIDRSITRDTCGRSFTFSNCSKNPWEFYVQPDSFNPCPEIIRTASHVSGDTASGECVTLVKKWLKQCSEKHTRCKSKSEYFPRRVLDVGPGSQQAEIRLIETNDLKSDYVCLSYCWGDSQPPCITLHATVASNRKKIPWDFLPRTFQDAIEFTRRLGFRYIWIDSLCIIQDDNEDWRREVNDMYEIYSSSALTIAATASSSSDGGCFSKAGKYHNPIKLEGLAKDHEPYPVFARRQLPHHRLHGLPLLERGWAYQERLLSPRVLHFAPQELVWECKEGTWCECTEIRDTPPVGGELFRYWDNPKETREMVSHLHPKNPMAIQWRHMVQDYTRLNLSFEKDKLPAIFGAAREMQSLRGRYLAGLWEDTFFEDLIWLQNGEPSYRPLQWRGPTWSWVSINSSVTYDYLSWSWKREPYVEIHAKLLQAECPLVSEDPTGEMKGTFIKVSGFVVSASFARVQSTWEHGSTMLPSRSSGNLLRGGKTYAFSLDYLPHNFTSVFDLGNDETSYDVYDGQTLFCLKVLSYEEFYEEENFCLVMREVESPPGYERIGLAMFGRGSLLDRWFKEVEVWRTVTIF